MDQLLNELKEEIIAQGGDEMVMEWIIPEIKTAAQARVYLDWLISRRESDIELGEMVEKLNEVLNVNRN